MSKPLTKKKTRPPLAWRIVGGAWYLFVVAAACGVGVVGNMASRSSLVREGMINPLAILNANPKEVFHDYDGLNLMILGTDDDRVPIGFDGKHMIDKVVKRGARADMIMVAHLDFDENRISGLSIPRDTGIRIPELKPGILKINGYYNVAPEGQGKEYMKQAVEKLLPGLKIDRTIALDYDAFQNLVDTVGGVPVVVPKGPRGKGLHYDDFAGDLHINLNPGPQTLTGKDAMGYVRFRHDAESDYGRQQRQKEFLTSFKSRIFHNLLKLPEIAEESKAVMGNALTDKEIIALVAFARKVKPENIKLGMLPTTEGRTRSSALRVDRSKRDEAMREYGLLPTEGSPSSSDKDSER